MRFAAVYLLCAIATVVAIEAYVGTWASWPASLYSAIIVLIGFSVIALFIGYRRWRSANGSSLMIIGATGTVLFLALATLLPEWIFPTL